ncbi:MAG: ribbon-helix-helix domain-containing protein [Acidobacteria bacterium]|nr:ribbon-helix-helix domain-containing protein [Acidobacteriota bacterium]
MTKTQIQLPDALYRDIKRLAAAREWSLAETLRRAAEQFLARYPAETTPTSPWRPPVSGTAGWRGLSHEAVHAAALDDLEPREVENAESTDRGGMRRGGGRP